MAYPAQGGVSFEDRVSSIEWTLLAKIRGMAPCGVGITHIEVLEKFLLRPEDQRGGRESDRLIKMEAAADNQSNYDFDEAAFY
jgi:hypothetical protein